MEEKLNLHREYVIHNCHAHSFTIDYIPKFFIGKLLPTGLAKNKLVAKIGMFIAYKEFSRYKAFFYSALKSDQEEVLNELIRYYPKSGKFAVLSIDFDFMGAGLPKYNFIKQLDDLCDISDKINREYNTEKILPFIGVDPRRKGITDLVKEYIENRGCKGIKLYPGLGFFPDDHRLFDIYDYCERFQIPITTHCLPVNKNHFRHPITHAMKKKAEEIIGYNKKHERKKKYFSQYLNHPHWYSNILQKYPKLKINLAHFGGNEEWDRYLDEPSDSNQTNTNWYRMIRDLLKKYPNVYSDISFTVNDKNLYPLLKNLVNSNYTKQPFYSPSTKVLFGSDFYMLQKDYKERRFGLDLRGYLTDDEFWLIAEDNPKKFLSNLLLENKY